MSMLHLLAHSAAACASLGPEAAWFGASPGTAGAAGACSHLAPVPHFLFSPRSPPDRAAGWAPPPTEPQQPAAGAAGGSDGESKKGGKNPKGLATGEPVRPKPPRAPRRALPKRTAPLTLEEVAGVQHLPLREAAAACGYAVTRFKFHCRELGVLRWRYRKIKSLDALIESSKRDAAKQVPETVDRLAGWVAQLEATKSRLVCAPLTTEVALPRHVEAFRQWKFKAAWNAKQFDGACDAPPRPCPPPVPCVLASA